MINQSSRMCYSDFSFGGGDRFKQAGRITVRRGFKIHTVLPASADNIRVVFLESEECFPKGDVVRRGMIINGGWYSASERSERRALASHILKRALASNIRGRMLMSPTKL